MYTPIPLSSSEAPLLQPNPYGLASATIVQPGDEHWTNRGFMFTSLAAGAIFAHSADCWVDGSLDKAIQICTEPLATPVYTMEYTLNWHNVDGSFDPKKAVEMAVEAGRWSVLERLLERGIANTPDMPGEMPVLYDPDNLHGTVAIRGHEDSAQTELIGASSIGTWTDAKSTYGVVEKKLLDAHDHIAGWGTLYMNPLVAAYASDMIVERDGVLVSRITGNRVFVGNFGDNAVYGHVGQLIVYLGPLNIVDANADASMSSGYDNTTTVQAEQTVAFAFHHDTMTKAVFTAPAAA